MGRRHPSHACKKLTIQDKTLTNTRAYTVHAEFQTGLFMSFYFVSLQAAMGAYTFLIFLFIIIGAIVFIFFFVPETKDRSTDEIARDLAFGRQSAGPAFSSQSMLLHEGVKKETKDIYSGHGEKI
jgi:hypothetical protein